MKILSELRRRHTNYVIQRKSEVSIIAAGHEMRFATESEVSKRWFFPRYLDGQQHEPNVTDLFCRQISPADTVFDIGANQGYFSVLSAKLAAQGAVHSFELDPVLIPLIKNSALLNRDTSPISICQAAVSDTDGDYVTFSPHIEGNLTTNSIHQKSGPSKVRSYTVTLKIDTYCEKMEIKPNFIKLDVEGAELEALSGMRQTLSRARPKLLVEVHPKQLAEIHKTPEMVVDFIMSSVPGYQCYMVDEYRKISDDYLVPGVPPDINGARKPVVLFFSL